MIKKVAIIIICLLLLITGCSKANPNDAADEYLQKWKQGKYNDMYKLLSSKAQQLIGEKDFTDRYNKIFDAIHIKDMDITMDKITEDNHVNYLPVKIVFHTDTIPEFEKNYTLPLVKEKDGWKIDWTPNLIFPELEMNDKVYIDEIEPKRGDILDRYKNILATDGKAYTVGAVPGAIPDKDEFAKSLAPILEVKEEYILKQLDQKWVKDDTFVPIKSYPFNISKAFKDELLGIKGVKLSGNHMLTRQYPGEDLYANITGYVQLINEKQLKEKEKDGYKANDFIGRQGIEESMETELKGTRGYILYAKGEKKDDKHVIAELPVKNGNNVMLTVDPHLQQVCYMAMGDHKGSIVALQPKTGEVLAMLSRPSYDPNLFPTGISKSKWEELSNDENYPFINRCTSLYSPGSTFKPFTAFMALDKGVITADTVVEEAKNEEWYPTEEWPQYAVRRVSHPAGPVNLRNALVWSDNIYFAWTALKLTGPVIEDYSKKIGFKEELPFNIPVPKSHIKKGSSPWAEPLVADTGYGQGEVQISPLQLASMYTAFVNDGDMMLPQLIMGAEPKPWIKDAIPVDIAKKISSMLIDVVNDNSGTAHSLKISDINLAAKTGTAQIGKQKDEEREIAWIVAYTTESDNPLLVCITLEVPEGQGRDKLKMAKKIFTEYMKASNGTPIAGDSAEAAITGDSKKSNENENE